MIVQSLLQRDFAQRRQFFETLLDILDEDTVIMMSDEAHFQLEEEQCRISNRGCESAYRRNGVT
jgi:hypothetical protein